MIHLALETPDRAEVIARIGVRDDCRRSAYPPARFHLLDRAMLAQPHVLFGAAGVGGGQALGCAAHADSGRFGDCPDDRWRLSLHKRLGAAA